ncbi:dynactin subunit 1-like isoform X2 [Limulus polyphemus]|nr:dynactin subunit 1-like isoform X2 [Limulus polyphemus]XP_022248904.1 dynactin subunit 1-like isoform X2 [Limulus polyphemus]XP_022248905.1 dynactin subunit 1-like isoform X2 [Limulus polyphemus]
MAEKPLKVGNRVEVVGKDVKGKVAFIGTTHFSPGKWVGVILDESKGKNNGTVQGKSYFQCPDSHGIFVRQSQLKVFDDGSNRRSMGGTPSPSPSPSTSSPNLTATTPQDESMRRSMGGTPSPSSSSFNLTTPGSTPRDENKSVSATLGEKTSKKSTSSPEGDEHKSQSFQKSSHAKVESSKSVTATVVDMRGAATSVEDKIQLLHKDQEIGDLKSEVKDLQEKLETLKLKRSEDKIKLKEHEKTKIQLQQLLEFKTRISESQADLQKQLAQAKKDAQEAIEAKQQHEDEMSDLAETVELATLDKEMAEEKCETLQAEIVQLKEKVEELTLDLEIIQNEIAEKGTEGAASNYQVKQLEQQNERLKEALVKLRDLSAHDKQEQQRVQKEVDHLNSEITELTRTKEKLSNVVESYEKQMRELKEQVDAALGAEEMVEQLTEKNLELEEKIRELQETVDDLEKLQDINDQLQESARETELELREEVDLANAKVIEANRKLEAMHYTVADYEQTIQKFRDLTEQLREANQDLRTQLQKESDRVAMATPAENFDFKVKFAETKAFARTIEMELRKLEVQQATQHLAYLYAFMPDNFFSRGGDHDGVLNLLLIPRIIAKAEILATQVREKFPAPEEITKSIVLKTHQVEQHSFASRLLHLLFKLRQLLNQYKSALNNCSVDLYMKIATLYPEMAQQEKAIDFYVELLWKDQLDENIPLETLKKAVSYFQSLYSVHLASEKVDCTALMADSMQLMGAASDAIYTDVSAICSLLQTSQRDGDMGALLKEMRTSTDDIRQFIKKVKRRLPQEKGLIELQFPEEVQEDLIDSGTHLSRVIHAVYLLRVAAIQQVVVSGEVGHIEAQKLKELAHESTDRAYGKEDSGPDCLKNSMNIVVAAVNKVSTAMQEGEFDHNISQDQKPSPPVTVRSQAIKGEAKDLEAYKFKLETRETDIIELKKALKIKSEEVSEMHVRKEMAEKKLELASRDSDERVERIQRQLDETKMMLKKKEKDFEETLDHLQADIDALETERGELKDKLKMLSKKALLEGLTKSAGLASIVSSPTIPTSPGTAPPGGTAVSESPMMVQQIQDLRTALKHVRNENIRLQTKFMQNQLADLPPLVLPSKPTGLGSLTGLKNMVEFEKEIDGKQPMQCREKISHLGKRTTTLLNELYKLSANPQVVDISLRKPGTEPVLGKSTPINFLLESTAKLRNLQKEAQQLQFEVTNLVAAQKQGGHVSSDFTDFPSPSFSKALAEKDGELVARLRIPYRGIVDGSQSNKSGQTVAVMLTIQELRQLHTKMIS